MESGTQRPGVRADFHVQLDHGEPSGLKGNRDVQGDALNPTGALFAREDSTHQLSSNGRDQPAENRVALVELRVDPRVELRGLEPLTPTLPGAGRSRDQAR